ncbi:nucleoside 2-deoxyribosyltransferase [Peribacillus asahii]|uniref:nucleoside 2-deoxyribosyltransferase n=1 Tax=Peribacillus asahii TaxID=228899 RepID=UPI0020799FD8|nr:nucleoside 2-deoxyribosyltransferase [Peribacillus asahii]USK68450.1 nucleoside 2-deoxyribosyltransferase [Peribacillus asahii]
MQYYLATDEKNKKQVRSLVKKLKTRGYNCLNDLSQTSCKSNTVNIGESEEQMIEKADFILVFLKAGKGSLYTIGYALALKKKIIVYSPEKEHYHLGKKSIFHNMPYVDICSGTFYKLEKMLHSVFVA